MRAAPVPSALPPRSFTTTRAPSRAKSSAISRPIPRPAPVTIAILPSRTPMGHSSFVGSAPAWFGARFRSRVRGPDLAPALAADVLVVHALNRAMCGDHTRIGLDAPSARAVASGRMPTRRARTLVLVCLIAAIAQPAVPARGVMADDIPVAHTPTGGYGKTFPAPVLAACTEPLAPGAPDLRGIWKAVRVERDGKPLPPSDPMYTYAERIEQCGNR